MSSITLLLIVVVDRVADNRVVVDRVADNCVVVDHVADCVVVDHVADDRVVVDLVMVIDDIVSEEYVVAARVGGSSMAMFSVCHKNCEMTAPVGVSPQSHIVENGATKKRRGNR